MQNLLRGNCNVFYREVSALETKVREVMRAVREIQAHSQPAIEANYAKFLPESTGPEQREFEESGDQIREVLIHGTYFSAQDMTFCLNYNTHQLDDHSMFEGIEALHRCATLTISLVQITGQATRKLRSLTAGHNTEIPRREFFHRRVELLLLASRDSPINSNKMRI